MNIRVVVKNVVYLFTSNVLIRLINAIATIFVAKNLGAHDYGVLSVALAFAMVVGYFTDLGLTHTVIREGTRPNADLSTIMSSFLKARLVLAFGTAVISVCAIFFLYRDNYLRDVLFWVVLPTIFGLALQGVGAVYFQIIQMMGYTALIRGTAGLITACSLIIAVALRWPLAFLAPIYGMSSLLGGVLSLLLVFRKSPFTKGWNSSILRGVISFTVGGFVVMILPQLGPLVLERVTSLQQVGYFAAAYRIPSVLYQVPGIIATAFYPLLFTYANANKEDEHAELVVSGLKLMSALGVLMSLPFILYPGWCITFLFGQNWIEAKNTLQLLAVLVILTSINYPLADGLSTKGRQLQRTILLLIILPLGAVLYSIFGGLLGSEGGGIASIVDELVLMIGLLILDPARWRYVEGLASNVISLVLTCSVCLLLLRGISPVFGIFLSFIIFMLSLIFMDRELGRRVLFATLKKDLKY